MGEAAAVVGEEFEDLFYDGGVLGLGIEEGTAIGGGEFQRLIEEFLNAGPVWLHRGLPGEGLLDGGFGDGGHDFVAFGVGVEAVAGEAVLEEPFLVDEGGEVVGIDGA